MFALPVLDVLPWLIQDESSKSNDSNAIFSLRIQQFLYDKESWTDGKTDRQSDSQTDD